MWTVTTRASFGFTLVELLVVVALLAILAAFALPALGRLAENGRATALADLLQSQLAHARASSVLRRRDIDICGSSDGETCDGAWSEGWIIHEPPQGNVLSSHRLDKPARLRRGSASPIIRFRSNGTSPLGNSRFYICNEKLEVVVQLVISRQGRVRRVQGLEPGQDREEAGCR